MQIHINQSLIFNLDLPVFVDVETDEQDNMVGIGYTQDGINLYYCTVITAELKQYLTKRNIMLATVFAVLVGIVMYPTVRDSYVAENVIFHSDETTTDLGSSQKHIQYIIDGAKDVAKRPAGYGPGTAGIVSIRNERGTVLTENYYVQIAYEVGILGLLVFVLINYLVYQLLRKSPANALKMALLASFWGLIATNMLLHTWSNEAVAVVWWMLAGYQIGLSKEFE